MQNYSKESKRKTPYNAFTEKLAATKKSNATTGVQSEALNPALVMDYLPVNKLTDEDKHYHHSEAVLKMKKMMESYNSNCDSEFFPISMFQKTNGSSKGRILLYPGSAGDTHPSAKFTTAFPFQKFKNITADLKLFGWPENVPIRRGHDQISGQMQIVLEAIKENNIYITVPGAEAVDTTPVTLESSSPDLAQ
ncbi:hypothetical protein INT47_003349 [Mucor saturninus]|uniref:Uncharacterized protein n=1 Tax=Mucor saturninus TaxID=64648 RepID=A0A8H7RG45_9FUNG|nr:hypothetical protein INT47_003349 [Mucor saturninus]